MARVKVIWCDDLDTPELGMIVGWEDLTGEERHELKQWLWSNGCGIYIDMVLVPNEEVKTAISLRWS